MNKKIKNILLDIKLEGNGLVNMDSNDQRWVYNNEGNHAKMTRFDNVSYGKKNFYRDENGKLIDKIKISRDCMLKEVFSKDYINTSPNIAHHDAILYSYIGSIASLLRGYMFAEKTETIKKKGAITLCDAEQTCNAIGFIETYSRGQDKTSKVETDTDVELKGDTTFFKRENVGNIKYATIGSIDLANLQFVSCDQTLDRYSFNPDKFSIYKSFLQACLPDKNIELGYYKFNSSIVNMAEYGVKFSNENVIFLVKELLKRILSMNIERKGSYAKIESLRIKLVENPINDTFKDQNNWINITSEDDINNLNFDIIDFYSVENSEEVLLVRKDIEDRLKLIKETAKNDAKEKAKTNKKEKKVKIETDIIDDTNAE